MADPTREELIALCERGFVLEEHWGNRDSAKAQRQIGEALALLKAGCEFVILRGKDGGRNNCHKGLKSDRDTWWISVRSQGFDYHENGGPDWNDGYDFRDDDTFYIPTAARLDRAKGEDWY